MQSFNFKVRVDGSLFFLISILFAQLVFPQSLIAVQDEARVNFNRDVKPILSDRCFLCHGPDAETRESDLRLDTEAGVAGGIVAGQPEASDLIARILSKGDDQMPPVDSNLALSAEEVKTLELWVAQGGKWEQHWSFVPPKKVQLPSPLSSQSFHAVTDSDFRFLYAGCIIEMLCRGCTGSPR